MSTPQIEVVEVSKVSLRQHIPAFISGFPPESAEVDGTPDGILAAPFVARWASQEGFSRFSVSDRKYLMAEMNDGKFWVVAFISGEIQGLPEWKSPRVKKSRQKKAG